MNYLLLGQAVEFYKARGYVYIDDAPWQVFHEAYHSTKPEGVDDVRIVTSPTPKMARFDGRPVTLEIAAADERFLVASGEQSFVQMMLDGQPIKKAICVTPCFRAENRLDRLHQRSFMKAELINAHDVDEGHLIHMIHDACAFYEQFFSVRVVKTEIGYDIVEKSTRFELGSYGIRTFVPEPMETKTTVVYRPLQWIYGTACAEPRLSIAIQQHSRMSGR